MAENKDISSFDFSIENTIERGLGDTELIESFLSPETATADTDELEDVVKTTEDKAPAKETKPKGKEIVQKEEGEEVTGQDLISSFLGSEEAEEQEEGEESEEQPEQLPTQEEQEEEHENQWSLLAKDLEKIGIFTKDEGEDEIAISTPEELRDRFISEKKKEAIEIVNKFIGQFGEDYQNAFEAIYVKGVKPKDYFTTYNTIESFASLDITKEENQVEIVRQALTDQGLEPEDIDAEIDQMKNYGDLESKAARYHKVLVKKEALKLQEMEQRAEQEQQAKAAIKSQYIQNVQTVIEDKLKTKEFDGIPINPKLANELQDFLLVDKYRTPSGELLTDFDRTILDLKRPENHAMKVKVALLLKILEKDPSLKTIQRSGVTKESSDLFDQVARQREREKSKAPQVNKPRSTWSHL